MPWKFKKIVSSPLCWFLPNYSGRNYFITSVQLKRNDTVLQFTVLIIFIDFTFCSALMTMSSIQEGRNYKIWTFFIFYKKKISFYFASKCLLLKPIITQNHTGEGGWQEMRERVGQQRTPARFELGKLPPQTQSTITFFLLCCWQNLCYFATLSSSTLLTTLFKFTVLPRTPTYTHTHTHIHVHALT